MTLSQALLNQSNKIPFFAILEGRVIQVTALYLDKDGAFFEIIDRCKTIYIKDGDHFNHEEIADVSDHIDEATRNTLRHKTNS